MEKHTFSIEASPVNTDVRLCSKIIFSFSLDSMDLMDSEEENRPNTTPRTMKCQIEI